MGLVERRAMKEFEDKRFPLLKKEVEQAAGFKVPIDIVWDTIQADGQGNAFEEYWTKVYFRPLIDALKAVTVDEMGKDALKSTLKKIIIQNKSGIYSADRIANFHDGVLTLDHEPATNIDEIDARKDGIQKTLEGAL